jgi:hypothetical protein
VQVDGEAVLHRGAVDLGREPAGARQRLAVEPGALADGDELGGRASRGGAAAAADVDAELPLDGSQAAPQRAEGAGGDPRGVPVHAQHAAERLEPEGVREARDELLAPVVVDDGLDEHAAEPLHALGEPARHPASVKRQIGGPRASTLHGCSVCRIIPRRAT